MEPLFKVGDLVRVRVRERTNHYKDYPCCFLDEMTKHSGQIFRIRDVRPNAYSNDDHILKGDEAIYLLDEDGHGWKWSSPMLEKIDVRVDSCGWVEMRYSEETLNWAAPRASSNPIIQTRKRNKIKFNFKF